MREEGGDIGSGHTAIGRVLLLRVCAWVLLFAGDVAMIAAVSVASGDCDARAVAGCEDGLSTEASAVVAVGGLFFALLLVLIPWDGAKYRYYRALAAAGPGVADVLYADAVLAVEADIVDAAGRGTKHNEALGRSPTMTTEDVAAPLSPKWSGRDAVV